MAITNQPIRLRNDCGNYVLSKEKAAEIINQLEGLNLPPVEPESSNVAITTDEAHVDLSQSQHFTKEQSMNTNDKPSIVQSVIDTARMDPDSSKFPVGTTVNGVYIADIEETAVVKITSDEIQPPVTEEQEHKGFFSQDRFTKKNFKETVSNAIAGVADKMQKVVDTVSSKQTPAGVSSTIQTIANSAALMYSDTMNARKRFFESTEHTEVTFEPNQLCVLAGNKS